jgi:hypothetical protein
VIRARVRRRDAAKITLAGIDVPDIAYYNLVEGGCSTGAARCALPVVQPPDKGIADFKIAAKRALGYPSHRRADEATSGRAGQTSRKLSFDGGGSKLVVDSVSAGSDGAKLLAVYGPVDRRASAPDARKRLTLRFVPKEGQPSSSMSWTSPVNK